MKKQSFVSIAKRSAVILSTLFLMSATDCKANGTDPIIDSSNNKPEVAYSGYQDGMLVFNVVYKNLSGEKFTLKVKDSNGDIIYIQDFTDKNFNKRFLMARDLETDHFTFVISKKGSATAQTFKVGITTKVLENVVVSRL